MTIMNGKEYIDSLRDLNFEVYFLGERIKSINLIGQLAMLVPLFWNEDNIPIGVQFASRFVDETTLFRLAGQLERTLPWNKRRPTIHCNNPF